MISVTTEALEKTDEEVQTKDTAPVSAKPVDEEVQTKDTAPVSTPPSSSDEEIKVVSQEQKKEVTPLQTPRRTPRERFPIASNGKLLEVAVVATTPGSGPRPQRKRTPTQDITIKEKGMFHIHFFYFRLLIRVGKWGSYSKTLDFFQVIQGVLLQEDSMHVEKLLVRVVGGSVPAVPCLP